MKLTTPFTILRDAFKSRDPESTTCYVDDTEVSMKQCGVEPEDRLEEQSLDLWGEECEEHPTNSHCKVYED